jgi:ssDNA-binding Zn-finger/Zn-ribbon topoisomerase 1
MQVHNHNWKRNPKMFDNQDLVTVISHLTTAETEELKRSLNSLKIESLVSGHDAKSRFGNLYYEIKVNRKDYQTAKQLIDKHKAKVLMASKMCPKCQYLGNKKIEKKGLWEKLFYAGTTLVQCNKCKNKFPI